MSRSFRESYMGKPYQAIRGWYWGKRREWAKMARYRLAAMRDEDGLLDFPRAVGAKWLCGLKWHGFRMPDGDYEIVRRRARKFLRLKPGRQYRDY